MHLLRSFMGRSDCRYNEERVAYIFNLYARQMLRPMSKKDVAQHEHSTLNQNNERQSKKPESLSTDLLVRDLPRFVNSTMSDLSFLVWFRTEHHSRHRWTSLVQHLQLNNTRRCWWCPKAGSLAFTPPGDEMSEVVSRCLPHRQLRNTFPKLTKSMAYCLDWVSFGKVLLNYGWATFPRSLRSGLM